VSNATRVRAKISGAEDERRQTDVLKDRIEKATEIASTVLQPVPHIEDLLATVEQLRFRNCM
jgi:hypothetical protein